MGFGGGSNLENLLSFCTPFDPPNGQCPLFEFQPMPINPMSCPHLLVGIVSIRIWTNQPTHSFLVGCLNPCVRGTSVRVVLPQPNIRLPRVWGTFTLILVKEHVKFKHVTSTCSLKTTKKMYHIGGNRLLAYAH